jgi:3-aminobutyryl-CoA ammonia-lyase
MSALEGLTAELRLRLSAADAHYGGELVSGARGLEILGDAVTELAVRSDGDEGLFAGYESVEFLAPLRAGDVVRATARLVRAGRSSRTVELELWREIAARPDVGPSAADLLDPPQLATRARGAYVVRAAQQRGPGGRAGG